MFSANSSVLKITARSAVIWVKAADVSDPQHGDVFNFDSAKWRGSGADVISGDWELAPEGVIYFDDYVLEIALQRKLE